MSYANGNFQTKPFSSAKFFNFKKSVNDLDLDAVTTNPYSLRRKCNNAPFVDRHQKHSKTGSMDMFLLKGLKYKEVCPANLERARYCILEGLDHSISNWC